MKVFHVERTDDGGDYDTFSDFVVIAEDEHDARSANPKESWGFGDREDITDDYNDTFGEWVKYSETKATLIGEAASTYTERTVVCASFHAG